MSQQGNNSDSVLSRVPIGLGIETGLNGSIPAVRVWAIVTFDRSFSGNEASGINEAFTDIEPFLNPQGELDARARIRATKFNYVRESKFRELIRRVVEPYLAEVAAGPSQQPGSYKGIADNVFTQALQPVVPSDKIANYGAFFKALLVKMAACSPATPCGACPACIGEGSAATTQTVGVSLPHNWEKKFKETDFKTFRTVRSGAKDLMLNVDGQTVEPSLTEALVRNRTPRTGDPDTAGTVDNTAQTGKVALGGMMVLREHMFKGPGYLKTTVFNPTRLELGMLAYEHLVEDVRRGAKTSSGAGVWSTAFRRNSGEWTIDKNDAAEPMLVVDEVLGLEGFTIKPPLAGTPLDVTEDDQGITRCFVKPLEGSEPNTIQKFDSAGSLISDNGNPVLVRYRGTKAVSRLRTYLAALNSISDANKDGPQETFRAVATFAASVIAYLIRPKKAIENIMAEFDAAQKATAKPAGTAPEPTSVERTQGRGGRRRGRRG